MPTFEIDHGGKTYEVDAPDMATAAASFPGASSPATSPALQVANPSQNWSNIGAESLQQAGIRPALTNRETALGRLMAMVPGNLGDEAAAAYKAGRLGPPIPALIQANATPENQAIYDSTLGKARDIQSRYGAAHPVENTVLPLVSNIAAALATGQPESLLGKSAQGGLLGAIQGFGSGEGTLDRLTKGGIGGITGTLISFLLGSLGNYANTKATPPEARGAAFVQNIADKSGQDINALAPSTKPITSAEALGPDAQTQLMALARREGTTGPALAPAMAERAANRADRVMEDMAQASGIHPDAARGNLDAVVAQGRADADPLYKAAFARPQTAMWSPRLQDFLDQPETKTGLARGLQIQRLEAVTKGEPFNPSDYAVRGMNDDGTPLIGWSKAETARRGGELAPGQMDIPNLRSMDAIKRGLDAMVNDYKNPNTGRLVLDEKGRALAGFRTQFVNELDKVAPPEYAAARATAGDYLSAQAAFDQGQKGILNGNLTERQFADMMARMTPAQQEALKGGIANKLFEQAQNGKISPKQFLTDRAQAKLAAALGPEKAAAFIGNLHAEAAMKQFETRAVPAAGSQTAALSQAMKEQDAFGGRSQIAQDAADAALSGHGPKGIAMNVASGWVGRQGQRILDATRTAGLSTAGRDEAGRLLMLPPGDLAAALRAGRRGQSGLALWLPRGFSGLACLSPPCSRFFFNERFSSEFQIARQAQTLTPVMATWSISSSFVIPQS